MRRDVGSRPSRSRAHRLPAPPTGVCGKFLSLDFVGITSGFNLHHLVMPLEKNSTNMSKADLAQTSASGTSLFVRAAPLLLLQVSRPRCLSLTLVALPLAFICTTWRFLTRTLA